MVNVATVIRHPELVSGSPHPKLVSRSNVIHWELVSGRAGDETVNLFRCVLGGEKDLEKQIVGVAELFSEDILLYLT